VRAGRSIGNKKIIAAVLVVAVIVMALFMPIIPIEETYADIEYFDRVEDYTELESFARLCRYEEVSSDLTEEFEILGRGFYHVYTIALKNTDNYGATFSIEFRLIYVNGMYETQTVSEYVGFARTQTFRAEFDTEMGQNVRGETKISVPTIMDERIVTKQRMVTDQKVVTKYRTAHKSMIDIILSR